MNTIHYVDHFEFPDADPPVSEWIPWLYDDVKGWHDESRDRVAARGDVQIPKGMQDTHKTLEIYDEALYPYMIEHDLTHLVEDNASCHNNSSIRAEHARRGLTIVGYTATAAQKKRIVSLIQDQTVAYKREQDRKAQVTKQTRELDRLPAWPPNSPDLNLIEVVWSWMVTSISNRSEV